MSTFLVTLREGAEAALIVAIVLAYLRSLERLRAGALGVGRGGGGGGGGCRRRGGAARHGRLARGPREEVVEGVVALAAVVLLTWMVFWMAARAGDRCAPAWKRR